MAEALKFVLMISQVFVYGDIQPPSDLQITVPMIGNVVLSWRHSEVPANTSVSYLVNFKTPETEDEVLVSLNYCTYPMLALHRGLKVTVSSIIKDSLDSDPIEDSDISHWVSKELPPYSGVEGSAAEQLTCQINIKTSGNYLLSCSWVPGARAPADTQYNLYYRCDYITNKCLQYVTEAGGKRQIGCRTPLSHSLIKTPKDVLVHVNGSSRSLVVMGMEKIFHSSEIEVIPPVLNVSFERKNKRITWKKPIHILPDSCFSYEVNIWSKDKNDTVTVSDVSFWRDTLQEPSNKQYLRVRAVGKHPCWYTQLYSSWTEFIIIDAVSSDLLGITISVCLTVSCIAVFVMCVRLWKFIFPRIPKPRNDLKDAFQNTQHKALIRCNSWDNEEVISYIEEIVASDKFNIPVDYTQVTNYPGCSIGKDISSRNNYVS
ncbi:interleukin-5 receptor subunit alpha [Mixophyes fleayi]|uniref:interleukin-5 receptor subunit alpha n=1 Tax=Mixophyes fleayi TaxID=3061075 RepID=UPI003F4DA0D7